MLIKHTFNTSCSIAGTFCENLSLGALILFELSLANLCAKFQEKLRVPGLGHLPTRRREGWFGLAAWGDSKICWYDLCRESNLGLLVWKHARAYPLCHSCIKTILEIIKMVTFLYATNNPIVYKFFKDFTNHRNKTIRPVILSCRPFPNILQ